MEQIDNSPLEHPAPVTENPEKRAPEFYHDADRNPEDNLEAIYEHADWYRNQLTAILNGFSPDVRIQDAYVVTIGEHRYNIGDLITFCLDRQTMHLLEIETEKIHERPDKLHGKVAELNEQIDEKVIDRSEKVHRKRVLAMIERLTVKANQQKRQDKKANPNQTDQVA